MATYRVTDPTTNRTVKLTGDSPPTEKELEQVFSEIGKTPEAQPKGTVTDLLSGTFGDSQIGQMTEGLVMDSIISPLTEFSRGLHKGTARFYEKADAVQTLLENVPIEKIPIPGVPNIISQGLLGKVADQIPNSPHMFKDWADNLNKVADDMPDTDMNPNIKTIYEFAGGTIPLLTEFATAKGILATSGTSRFLATKGFEQLNDVAKFAVVSALDEFSQNPENSALLEGAKKGAMVAMAFPIAAKGLELLKNAGKGAARNFIHFTTGSIKAAKDFVDNPRKYNLNPFGKVKTAQEVKEANNALKKQVNDKYAGMKDSFKMRQRRETELLDLRLKDRLAETQQTLANSKESLMAGSKQKLEDVSAQASNAIQKNNKAIAEKTMKIYDDSLVKYDLLKKEYGEKVDAAITSTLNNNPNAGISSNIIKKKWDTIVNKLSPFKITQKAARTAKDPQGLIALAESNKGLYKAPTKQVAERATAAGSQSDAKTFSAMLQEFNKLSKEKTLNIGYLQRLKKDIKIHSQKAYSAGNPELGRFYSELSKSVDPAKTIAENPSLSANLKEIAEANKNFSSYLPKYEEAIKNYFKKDAQGGFIPDIDKAVNAIRRTDVVSLRQMQKADMALLPEDRILPKVDELVKQSDKFEAQAKGMVSVVKNKAKQDLSKLHNAAKQTIDNIKREQRNIRFADKEKMISDVNKYVNSVDERYRSMVDGLQKAEQFYDNQDKLRSFKAAGTTLSGMLQRAGLFGVYGGAGAGMAGVQANPFVAVSAGVLTGLSPIVPYHILRGLLESDIAKELVGGKALQSNKKRK